MTAAPAAPEATRFNLTVERGNLLTTSALARAADRSLEYVRRRIASGEIQPLYRLENGTGLFSPSLVEILRRGN
ncbi:MAG: hypothetical protein JNJ82_15385 [Opitutaceae bacterium]|nr:hypothetical protein [Opitutaceae bacterium]